MSQDIKTVSATTTVAQARSTMKSSRIHHLLVREGADTDLLELIGRGSQRPVERGTRWTLRNRGPRRAGPSARRERRS